MIVALNKHFAIYIIVANFWNLKIEGTQKNQMFKKYLMRCALKAD
jgi:hypothetical protein